jgi:DUF1680 family protein
VNNLFPLSNVRITQGFWGDILQTNAETAIFHQWDRLVKSGAIENFRIAAGESPHFRTGFFFSDSDVYKWLDAACRIALHRPSDALLEKIDSLSALIRKAQEPDGYIFTYNQIHFPGQRWMALPIEHELYCHGHLIEACLSHQALFPEKGMLPTATLAANLICEVFLDQPAEFQPGHQEIEIALLKLYEATGNKSYQTMAEQFLERRGRVRGWAVRLFAANQQNSNHNREVARQRKDFEEVHPEVQPFTLPPMNTIHSSLPLNLRFLANTLSGKYFQTHQPILEQAEPVGHSVRFGYTMAAQTRLLRQKAETKGLDGLAALWDSMVRRRMYVTGGLGSLPVIEGFGRDFELDPKLAYAETCATIASLLWNWEMLLATGEVQYAELFEWQLYNAALVGIGLDGHSYLYNNPLASDGELTREPWFQIPCCPSNISRIFAALGQYLFTFSEDELTIQQYISGETDLNAKAPLLVKVDSDLPMGMAAEVTVLKVNSPHAQLTLRVPGWSEGMSIRLNDFEVKAQPEPPAGEVHSAGYSPYNGQYLTLPGPFRAGDRIHITFHPAVKARQVDPRVGLGKINTVLTYGPLVFCGESPDNPGIDLSTAVLDTRSFNPRIDETAPGRLVLDGQDTLGRPIRLIPYYAWANRGPSQMRVFFRGK